MASIQDYQFYEGSVLPKPRINCVQHESEITHGCSVKECPHPFYCGSCAAHDHDSQDPYLSLKNIDQFIFEISSRMRSAQLPYKSIHSQIISNADNKNLIKWQNELEPHFKSIENYINAQKQLISSDVIQISNKVYEVLDIQRQQVFRKLDDFLMNYKIQFSEFKSYHDHIFQLLKKKYRYLGDSNTLSARLNSLDSKLAESFLLELRESIIQSENLTKNAGINASDIEKVFKEMNILTSKLPNYKQLSDFEVIPQMNISGQSSIKILDQIKVQIEGHFKEACINFYQPVQKLQIPSNQMPTKKHNNFLQNFGRNSLNNNTSNNNSNNSNNNSYGFFDNVMGGSNNNNKSQQAGYNNIVPPIHGLQHSNSVQNGLNSTNLNQYSSNNYGSPNFQNDILLTSQSRSSKPKIFQKQGSIPRNSGSGNTTQIISATGISNHGIQLPHPISNTNLASYSSNNLPSLPRQNSLNSTQQNIPINNYISNTQILQQPMPVLNSQFLKLKKEFQIQLPQIPKFMCYLTNGYIVMAAQNELLRILDTNTNSIIHSKQLISREIKIISSLQPDSDSLYSTEQPTILNFALSNIDSVIILYSFNTKTKEVIQKNSSIVGFSSPVTQIVDLFPICHLPLLAAGDESGEVSIFDYEKTNGYGLEKFHQTPITQLLVISSNNTKYTSIQSQLNYQPSKFISFSAEDQVLVIYAYSVDKFQKHAVFNVSHIGSGLLYLRNHPEFEQFIAVCKNQSLRVLKFENKNIIDQLIEQRARDIAIFSVKESMNENNDFLSLQDVNLSGLVFSSEQDSDKICLFKSSYTSSIIQKEQTLQTIFSSRKILYVDNKNRLFIMINNFNNFVQIYDIKP